MIILSACTHESLASKQSFGMYWLEDKNGEMTFEDVMSKDLSEQWTQTENASPNFGFKESVYWFSLPIINNRPISSPMLLELAFSLHDYVDVYVLNGNDLLKTYQVGDLRPFSERPLNHRHFLFPYTVPANTELRAVVRLETSDTNYFPVNVMDYDEFFTQDQQHLLLLGLFFGFLSIMLVYNLLLYISTKEKSYLYYVWFTAATVYLQLVQKGIGFQYLWSNHLLFNHLSVPASNLLLITCSLMFIKKFLGLGKKQYVKIIGMFNCLIWFTTISLLVIIAMVLSNTYVVKYSTVIIFTAVLGIVVTVCMISVLCRLAYKGNGSAQILLLAWMSLLFGVCLFALGRIGIFESMFISENAMLIGSTFEAALISFALARQIKNERDARMLAQEEALTNERNTLEVKDKLLSLQKQNTEELEKQVKQRTKKLQAAMLELQEANHKLDNLARIDSLTGLSNRRNFDELFEEAWQLSLKNNQTMSLLMCDIDHFKTINDTYGHQFGDQCLVKVAKVLKNCVDESKYLAARFGGEEFIIMLPSTEASVAVFIAQRIRIAIDALSIEHEGKKVHFTMSVGIATKTPTQQLSGSVLRDNADQALYQAKEAGRNRVVLSTSSN